MCRRRSASWGSPASPARAVRSESPAALPDTHTLVWAAQPIPLFVPRVVWVLQLSLPAGLLALAWSLMLHSLEVTVGRDVNSVIIVIIMIITVVKLQFVTIAVTIRPSSPWVLL